MFLFSPKIERSFSHFPDLTEAVGPYPNAPI